MCVLQESPALPTADQVIDRVLAAHPGTLVQFELGTTVLVTDCGDGSMVHALARRFPRSLFAGLDQSVDEIDAARMEAKRLALANIWFESGDVTTQRFGGIFHYVIALGEGSGQPGVLAVLRAIHRSLRRRGTLFYRPNDGAVSPRLLEAAFSHVEALPIDGGDEGPVFVARR